MLGDHWLSGLLPTVSRNLRLLRIHIGSFDMRRTASSARLVLLLLVWPSTADAQDSTSAPKNVEVSAVVSGFMGTDLFGLGVRVSGRTGGRSSFEGGLDWTDALHTRHWADQII